MTARCLHRLPLGGFLLIASSFASSPLAAQNVLRGDILIGGQLGLEGDRIINIGDGVDPNDAVNVSQLDASESRLQGLLDDEIAARAAAETRLAAAITEASTLRDAGDDALAALITDEGDARLSADAALELAMEDEVLARGEGDRQLAGRIAGERTAREAADADMTDALAGEARVREQADLALSQRIDSIDAVDAQDIAALQAADAAAMARMDGLEGRIDGLEADVDRLDDKIEASTALAVALGGGFFLPGKDMNLTMNLATYEGAHAGSVQVGALVSDHVAVNAGIGASFNKRKKSAARVGVTLGF